ncbi:Mut7-C RNAse domain-containing protein [Nitrosomonas marina]|uniref:Twitching motility protein PilT n=1 Tax=Nitrosomonas marina TaxID=917 RepID=A0A1H8G6N4_9PROT|nr:Mut7-C RNAse domain-containing protein [Nitrosomonas marina]SEN39686.1 hypothetical protein SAMN05216325_11666 [Nitrosomonas marina]
MHDIPTSAQNNAYAKKYVYLLFYGALNDFLSPAERNTAVAHGFNRKTSVKDAIESHNVPHTEIDLIIVNGVSVDFNYYIQPGDNIHAHPLYSFTARQASHAQLVHLAPRIVDKPSFIIDVNLGRLARYLRLLGFDCIYCNHFDDTTIAEISSKTQRVILTRDRKLLQRKIIKHGYFVRAEVPKAQAKEVLTKFNLRPWLKPLTRCTCCNGELNIIEKQLIAHRLKPLTKKYYNTFLICPDCGQIYWQGSHSLRVKHLIKEFSRNPLADSQTAQLED